MLRILKYSVYTVFTLSILFPVENLFIGYSQPATIDFVNPEVELITPNGGELLPNNEYSTFSWEATDQFGIMENGINFELSTTHMPEFFNELVSDISNSYNTDILLPDVNTQYAKIKIIVFDSFGNSSKDVSEQFFTIGTPTDMLIDQTIHIHGYSELSTLDFVNPQIDFQFPENNESFNSGEEITLSWTYEEDHYDGTDFGILLSLVSGSFFDTIAVDLAYDEEYVFELPDITTTSALFKIWTYDEYGNYGENTANNYFSINAENTQIPDTTLSLIGLSELSTLDFVPPIIDLTHPENNEVFNSSEQISVEWTSIEDHFDGTDINISLSPSSGEIFDTLVINLPYNENYNYTLPDINTESALFKIWAYDHYGNYSENIGDNFFSIEPNMSVFEDSTITLNGYSDNSILDFVSPVIDLIYPNGGEHVLEYNNVIIEWDFIEDNFDGTDLNFDISFEIGGWYLNVDNNIDGNTGEAVIDLSLNGEIPERLYGLLKITGEDAYGNPVIGSNPSFPNSEYSDDYFILGDPRGDINLNYINEEDKSVLVDWSWIENQVIAITDEAIASLSNYDYITIYDEDGITPTLCDEDDFLIESGLVELATIDISEEVGSKTVSLPCGFDYCSLGGSRIPGYYPGNTIKFSVGVHGEDDQYIILPETPHLIDEDMTFNNETFIINSFTIIGDRINTTGTLSIDEREWDQFSVYGKVTNHQGSANRSCNDNGVCDVGESLVDCFDDCCPEAGTGENDEWCLLETLNGISIFQDNLISGNYVPYVPAGTSSATFNYRVWLLDNNGVEVVKTIDTEINYESDDLVAYHTDLSSGWNWISLNIENSESMSINNLFANSESSNSDYIKSQTGSSTYYSSGGVWYPDWNMDLKSLYLIDVSEEMSILYQGNYSDPSAIEIPIAAGWNWISYTPSTSSAINTALALFTPSNQDYIKSQTSSSTYYSSGGVWYPDITLQPTSGYMLSASIEQSLFYPEVESNVSEEDLLLRNNYVPEFNYREYEFNASATIELDLPHLDITENDRIRIFHNNELRGVVQADICPLNDKILFNLMIYSNNQSDQNLTLVYTNSITGKEYTIRETIDFEKDTILGNAYNPILLTDAAIPYQTELLVPYPNPFNPSTTINFSLTEDYENLSINVYDIRGRLAETLYAGFMPYGYHSIIWNASHFASGIYFVNMTTKDNRFTKKITLIK